MLLVMVRNKYRINKILNLIPAGVKSVLDIGSRGEIFNKKYNTTTLDILEDSDIKQDLNKDQKLHIKDDKFDLVVLNQILEHLPNVEKIVDESKRVSGRYIFVGLPNEMVYSMRLKFLFGIHEQSGYLLFGHKHRFTIKEIEKFILKFFGKYEKRVYFGAFTGASVLPWFLTDWLAKRMPTLFAKEVYYLIRVKDDNLSGKKKNNELSSEVL